MRAWRSGAERRAPVSTNNVPITVCYGTSPQRISNLTFPVLTLRRTPAASGTGERGGHVCQWCDVALNATPAVGCAFASWKQGAAVLSTSPSLNLTLTNHLTLTANFVATTRTISATAAPVTSGSITGAESSVTARPSRSQQFPPLDTRSPTGRSAAHRQARNNPATFDAFADYAFVANFTASLCQLIRRTDLRDILAGRAGHPVAHECNRLWARTEFRLGINQLGNLCRPNHCRGHQLSSDHPDPVWLRLLPTRETLRQISMTKIHIWNFPARLFRWAFAVLAFAVWSEARAVTNVFLQRRANRDGDFIEHQRRHASQRRLSLHPYGGWLSSYAGGPPTDVSSVSSGRMACRHKQSPPVRASVSARTSPSSAWTENCSTYRRSPKIARQHGGHRRAFEIMPQLNGEDAFNDPAMFDCSPAPAGRASRTPMLAGCDTYKIHLWVDWALTALTLIGHKLRSAAGDQRAPTRASTHANQHGVAFVANQFHRFRA